MLTLGEAAITILMMGAVPIIIRSIDANPWTIGLARLGVATTGMAIIVWATGRWVVPSRRELKVLAAASTVQKAVAGDLKGTKNKAAAAAVGKAVAEKAKAAGVENVAFDRSGFRYHGRIAALADAAREAGLKF